MSLPKMTNTSFSWMTYRPSGGHLDVLGVGAVHRDHLHVELGSPIEVFERLVHEGLPGSGLGDGPLFVAWVLPGAVCHPMTTDSVG